MTGSRKVMMLGEIGVGKTSITRRLVFNQFDADYKATMGVDIYAHTRRIVRGGSVEECTLALADVDGDLGDSIMGDRRTKGSQGAMVICDLTRPSTFEGMLRLVRQFQEAYLGRPVVCIANKLDLAGPEARREQPTELRRMGIPLIHTSALTGEAVEEACDTLAVRMLEWKV